MAKKTPAEVAQALGIPKRRIKVALAKQPQLRPREWIARPPHYLWSEDEVMAMGEYLAEHPSKRKRGVQHPK